MSTRGVFADPPHVETLVEGEATKRNIIRKLKELQGEIKPRDVGLFFFSGHGGKDQNNNSYLAPIDFDVNREQQTGISQEELKKILCNIDGNLFVMIDACHSGGISLGSLAQQLGRRDAGVNFFASSTGQQRSWEFGDLEAGVFAHFVELGLRGKAEMDDDSDDLVSAYELERFVKDNVSSKTDRAQMPLVILEQGSLGLSKAVRD